MKRRQFITLLGGAAVAWPLAARAQSSMPHVGVLRPFGSPESDEAVEALRAGLHDLGYDEGRNIVLDIRYSGNRPETLRTLAAQLVALETSLQFTRSGVHDPRGLFQGLTAA